MAAVAGPSSPTIRKKLSAIPEEPFPLPPLLRRSNRRPPPNAHAERPSVSLSSQTPDSSPDLNLSQEKLVLCAEAKALYTSGVDSLKKGKKGVALALPLFRQAYTLFMVELQRPDKAEKALNQMAWCMATLALRARKEREFDKAIKGFEEVSCSY
ncbi:hypothetical protein BCR35DRAFT_114868 [Leucosporidium creatinivorum]|uniref:Uncharacterized protein n=1 Tax=Leucosporidium creatinivorum TaxID=106004 RepID=A0A1Y2EZY7_9BASI|nr:hypothetical protein BCR35DRAFT_114868 [Leucosporidium creatinivorum]